jgi:hypothetical protein
MPKYKVVKPIEHNQTLYLPETSDAPASAKSVSNGMDIPVDASGTVELDEAQASSLRDGQIAPLPASSPVSEEPKRQHGRTQR